MVQFPDVDAFRKQVTKINDEEIRAAFWLATTGVSVENGLKAWGFFTEAEHFRAGLAAVTVDEAQWPEDHKQVLAALERIADEFAKSLFGGAEPPSSYPRR